MPRLPISPMTSDSGSERRKWAPLSAPWRSRRTRPTPRKAAPRFGLISADSQVIPAVRIRPKGLRAFDRDDSDFFLGLLPGPRDREGLPESLHFWKVRIEPGEYDDPFAVGLLTGPSGSGKTSMVKAGLLCRLSPNEVTTVYVEASSGTTETRLLTACGAWPAAALDSLTLPETIAGMRSRALLPSGRKLLIVLDQFEQWLHADHDSTDTERGARSGLEAVRRY